MSHICDRKIHTPLIHLLSSVTYMCETHTFANVHARKFAALTTAECDNWWVFGRTPRKIRYLKDRWRARCPFGCHDCCMLLELL